MGGNITTFIVQGDKAYDTNYSFSNGALSKYERNKNGAGELTTYPAYQTGQKIKIEDQGGNNSVVAIPNEGRTQIDTTLGAGNDDFTYYQRAMDATNAAGDSVTVHMGNGTNFVNIEGRPGVSGSMSDNNKYNITGGNGTDTIGITAGGNVTIRSNSGDDRIEIRPNYLKTIDINSGAGRDYISVPLAAGTIKTKEDGTTQEADRIILSNLEDKPITGASFREENSSMFVEIIFAGKKMTLILGELDTIEIAGRILTRGDIRRMGSQQFLDLLKTL